MFMYFYNLLWCFVYECKRMKSENGIMDVFTLNKQFTFGPKTKHMRYLLLLITELHIVEASCFYYMTYKSLWQKWPILFEHLNFRNYAVFRCYIGQPQRSYLMLSNWKSLFNHSENGKNIYLPFILFVMHLLSSNWVIEMSVHKKNTKSCSILFRPIHQSFTNRVRYKKSFS